MGSDIVSIDSLTILQSLSLRAARTFHSLDSTDNNSLPPKSCCFLYASIANGSNFLAKNCPTTPHAIPLYSDNPLQSFSSKVFIAKVGFTRAFRTKLAIGSSTPIFCAVVSKFISVAARLILCASLFVSPPLAYNCATNSGHDSPKYLGSSNVAFA